MFARSTQRAARSVALQVFRHLHALSLRFHLERQTGGMTRDIERGTRGDAFAVSTTRCTASCRRWWRSRWSSCLLACKFDVWFAGITFVRAGRCTSRFTVTVTEWRTHFRRAMNELDRSANTRAIDALINYETVKYFGNERIREPPLRRKPAATGARGGQVADLAVGAQHSARA